MNTKTRQTEGLAQNADIEINGHIEALLTDLRRRYDAGELVAIDFTAHDVAGNTLHGKSDERQKPSHP